MIPSITAAIMPSASRLRIGSMEVKRDRTSPTCRFSKKAERQPEQVVEQPRAELEVQDVLHDSRTSERSAVVAHR